jgi:enamine deaminase RidA (YjgF/YER057c/UK114 family)
MDELRQTTTRALCLIAITAVSLSGCADQATVEAEDLAIKAADASDRTPPLVQRLNPDTLAKSPAYSQLVVVDGPARMIYVGGQNAVDTQGQLVGKGDLAAQTTQVLNNVEAALTAGGAGIEDVVKWNIYIVQGQSVEQAFAVYQELWGSRIEEPSAVTGTIVAGLAVPGALIEVDAIAAVPWQRSQRAHRSQR